MFLCIMAPVAPLNMHPSLPSVTATVSKTTGLDFILVPTGIVTPIEGPAILKALT